MIFSLFLVVTLFQYIAFVVLVNHFLLKKTIFSLFWENHYFCRSQSRFLFRKNIRNSLLKLTKLFANICALFVYKMLFLTKSQSSGRMNNIMESFWVDEMNEVVSIELSVLWPCFELNLRFWKTTLDVENDNGSLKTTEREALAFKKTINVEEYGAI